MSERSVAAALGYYLGKPYTDIVYDVRFIEPEGQVSDEELEAMKSRLKPHGYEKWYAETQPG